MSATIVSTQNAEHYTWGGAHADACDAWYLLRMPSLHIIEERMPPATSETRHRHLHARQFFYVLEGRLTIGVEDQELSIEVGEGIEIAPGQIHQAHNRGKADLRILVTSQPPSHGDRIEE